MIFQNKKDIFELMESFDKSSISELEICTGADFCIKLSKSASAKAKNASGVSKAPEGGYEDYEPSNPSSNSPKIIKAPLVGTFYSSPSPEAGPYVKPGDRVSKGTVVCIIEAMKTMNEIESDLDGEIAEALVKNGSPVEYGQPLFKLK